MSVKKFALRMVTAAALAVTLASAASAAVYPPGRQLPAQVVSAFKSSPASLLQQFSNGGPQLISRVRAGQILNLSPLCGGLPPEVAWPYLKRVGDVVLPEALSERKTG